MHEGAWGKGYVWLGLVMFAERTESLDTCLSSQVHNMSQYYHMGNPLVWPSTHPTLCEPWKSRSSARWFAQEGQTHPLDPKNADPSTCGGLKLTSRHMFTRARAWEP